MGSFKEIKGDLIQLALAREFDVVVQGNNCFCIQGAGIAPQFVKAFGTDKFVLEHKHYRGDYNKLGTIEYKWVDPTDLSHSLVRGSLDQIGVVNAYTQYDLGIAKNGDIPLDYDALTMCMKKINHRFKGLKIGLPLIGCGLAGGDWEIVKDIIQSHLVGCHVTIVHYEPNNK